MDVSPDANCLNVTLSEFNYIFIVMEAVDLDLKKLFGTVPGTQIDEEHILTMFYNMLCAVNFIHSCNIIHRDIKPANILIDSNCNVKLCDFGLSRAMPKQTVEKKQLDIFRESEYKVI